MSAIDHTALRGRGNIGEDFVAEYLEDHGCEILCRNYTAKNGEIDIIAENEARVIFVEVKSRAVFSASVTNYGRPSAAVTWDKQKHILSAARAYLRAHPIEKMIRFDVAEVFLSKGTPTLVLDLNYIKGAFVAEKGRNSYE